MRHILSIVFVAFILTSSLTLHTSHAATPPASVAQTGQTICYDAAGAVIACSGSGQDGELKMGVAWPTPRFVDNSVVSSADRTVTDKLTGLIWAKDANLMKTRNPAFDTDATANDGRVTWQHALDYIKKLNTENYLGHNDWRLPNRNELASLAHKGQANNFAWLNTQGFTTVQSSGYWSSTSFANYTGNAWIVGMNVGTMGSNDAKYNSYSVWSVRSGQSGTFGSLTLPKTGQTTCSDASGTTIACSGTGQDGELQSGAVWPNPRFVDNGDQTETDGLSGLIWSKNGNPAGTLKTWQAALDYIKTLNSSNYLGHNDWRLPNANELESLVHKGQVDSSVWLNTQGFNSVQSYYYWSSTSHATNTSIAWLVYMGFGTVDINGSVKYNSHSVWPVRSGLSGSFGSLALSSPATPFSATQSGTSSTPVTLTLSNAGAATAIISAISITGTDATQFSVASGGTTPCSSLTPTLAAGVSCTLNVTFTPTTIGVKTATLQITSNDAVNPTLVNSLTGTSVAPAKPGDCDNSGTVTIAEVQSAINMFLGLKTVEACVNLDGVGGVSIAEVQKVINSFLGL
jgi:hypothetical protein